MRDELPLRGVAIVEHCSYCERDATDSCERCNRPLCDEHVKGSDLRCDECESEHARRLGAIRPLRVATDFREAVRLTLFSGVGSAAAFGGITGLVAIVAVLAGTIGFTQALYVVLVTALFFGVLGAGAFALLAVPFLGLGGGLAATRALRRKLERRRYLRERPGRRRIASAASPAIDPDEEE